jgi:hypothetical protein
MEAFPATVRAMQDMVEVEEVVQQGMYFLYNMSCHPDLKVSSRCDEPHGLLR